MFNDTSTTFDRLIAGKTCNSQEEEKGLEGQEEEEEEVLEDRLRSGQFTIVSTSMIWHLAKKSSCDDLVPLDAGDLHTFCHLIHSRKQDPFWLGGNDCHCTELKGMIPALNSKGDSIGEIRSWRSSGRYG